MVEVSVDPWGWFASVKTASSDQVGSVEEVDHAIEVGITRSDEGHTGRSVGGFQPADCSSLPNSLSRHDCRRNDSAKAVPGSIGEAGRQIGQEIG